MASTFPPIRAIIFDVDGTLINTEDIYTEIYNNILHSYGKPDLPWSIKALQQSRGTPGTTRVLEWAHLQTTLTPTQWKDLGNPHTHLFTYSRLLPGVAPLLQTLAKSKIGTGKHAGEPLILALASSSSRTLYHKKTSHIPLLASAFPDPELCVFSDDPDFTGGERRKKPFPDLFLLAWERINLARFNSRTETEREGEVPLADKAMDTIRPEECLVIEDSIAGVEAARRAGMRVLWVPHPGLRAVCRGKEMDVLMGRTEEGGVVPVFEDGRGVEEGGESERLVSEDGWAEMRGSLVGFDVGEYGIVG